MQLVLFELVCGLVVTHDPAHIVNGYPAPWCVADAPGGAAWFGSVESIAAWREAQHAAKRKGSRR